MFRKKSDTNKVLEYLKKEERIVLKRKIANRVLIFFFFIGSVGGLYALTLKNETTNNVKNEDVEFISEESFVIRYVTSYFSADVESIEFVKSYSSDLVTKPQIDEVLQVSDVKVGKVENKYKDGYYVYEGSFKLNEVYFSYKLNMSIDEYLVLNNIEFKEFKYELPTTDSSKKVKEIFSNYVDLTKEEYDEYDEVISLFFKNYSSDYMSVKVMYDKVEPLHENTNFDLETLQIVNSGKDTEKDTIILNVKIDTIVTINDELKTVITYNYLIEIDQSNNKILNMEQII